MTHLLHLLHLYAQHIDGPGFVLVVLAMLLVGWGLSWLVTNAWKVVR